jgi:hypothetical protein
LVDPYDVEAIAAGIRALDTDATLRERLAAAGSIAAKRFGAAAYASRLEEMYAQTASSTK